MNFVDTGCGITFATKRKIRGYVNPVDVLARIGVDGTNVTKVIITHIYFDHVGGVEMFPQAFPKATFYIQKKEFDFWIKHPVAKRFPFAHVTDEVGNKALAALEGTDRLVFVCGDQKIMPGMSKMSLTFNSVFHIFNSPQSEFLSKKINAMKGGR